jgi:hypothetical protein
MAHEADQQGMTCHMVWRAAEMQLVQCWGIWQCSRLHQQLCRTCMSDESTILWMQHPICDSHTVAQQLRVQEMCDTAAPECRARDKPCMRGRLFCASQMVKIDWVCLWSAAVICIIQVDCCCMFRECHHAC